LIQGGRAAAFQPSEVERRRNEQIAKRRRRRKVAGNGGDGARAPVLTARAQLFQMLDDPTSSTHARVIASIVLALTLVSVTTLLLQTLPAFLGPDGEAGTCPSPTGAWRAGSDGAAVACHGDRQNSTIPVAHELAGCRPCPWPRAIFWWCVEAGCSVAFTVEYLLRLVCCPPAGRTAFVLTPLNVVDLAAILPFYLSLLPSLSSGSTQVVRIFRLARIFRLFKSSKQFKLLQTLIATFTRSLSALGMTMMLVLFANILFSSLVWFCEKGDWDPTSGQWLLPDGEPSPFDSIPTTMWWCIVTFTTVGYGDLAPVTPLGQFFGALAQLSGLLVIALPASVIGTNFDAVYSERRSTYLLARITGEELPDDEAEVTSEDKRDKDVTTDIKVAMGWRSDVSQVERLAEASLVFKRYEKKMEELALVTRQMGALLHQVEGACERIERTCNDRRVSARELELPSQPLGRVYSEHYVGLDEPSQGQPWDEVRASLT